MADRQISQPAWLPHRREFWPGTRMGLDGKPASPSSAGCALHNCVEIVQRDDGAWRCLLCHLDDEQFQRKGRPQHSAMLTRYEAWAQGKGIPWQEPQP